MRLRGQQITLDGYTITGLLGSGGTGNVFEAQQHSMQRTVAVKILQPDLAEDPEFRARIEREAVAIGNLSHPHVIAVHDFVQSGGFLAIVMQHVDGGSLMDAIRPGIDGSEAIRILRGVASALDHAHRRGLLHRDVKPHNVLLERDGDGVYLADFGLVKLDGAALTRTGRELMGTWAYMAPELLRGGGATPASDRYALAVTAYQALSGGYPFPGGQDLQAPRPSLRDRDPLAFVDDTPAAAVAAEVFARALAADPDERPSSAAALVEQLAAALAADPAVAERVPAFQQEIEAPHPFTSWDTNAALDETHVPEPVDVATTTIAAPAADLVDVADPDDLKQAPSAERDRRPRGRAARRAPALAAGVLLLAGAGAAAALTLGDREQPSTPSPATIVAGDATFSAPAGVEPAADPEAVTRAAFGQLDTTDAAAIGTPADGVAIATVAEGTTPLTPASTARGEIIDVAGGRARRYTNNGVITAIAQTPATVVRVACTRASETCEKAIDSMRLGDEQLQADPIAAVQTQLRAALDEPRGSRARLTLPTADLQRRANRASAIAAAYRKARDTTAEVSKDRPRDRDLAALTAELDAAAAAYTEISQAAGNRSAPGDRRGRAALRRADAALKARRARFTSRGYDLPWPSTEAPRAATITPRETIGSSTSTSTSEPGSAAAEAPASGGNTGTSNPPAANNSSSSSGGGSTCDLGPC